MRPSAATRPAFFAALASPFLRSQSTAASRSPLGFAECGFAIHHAGPGLVAELFHHACGDVRHCYRSLSPIVHPAARRRCKSRTHNRSTVKYVVERKKSRTVVMDSGFRANACHWAGYFGPDALARPRDDNYSASVAICSFARAIQLSTRPGSPTSSPILCAATGESSAICQT